MQKKFVNFDEAVATRRNQTSAELGTTGTANGMGMETIKSETNPKILRVGTNKLLFSALLFVFCVSVNAQTVSYTDPSGVTATYTYSTDGVGPVEDRPHARLTDITNFPSSVTKWVIPEFVTFSNGTFPVREFRS
jgi:hypothetical protein